jgi:hypothetical protein
MIKKKPTKKYAKKKAVKKISGIDNNNTNLALKIKAMYPKMNLTFSVNKHDFGIYALEFTGNGYYIIAFSPEGKILFIKGLKSGRPFKKRPKFI